MVDLPGAGGDVAPSVHGARAEEERRLSEEFGPFDGRIWLNTAHQGPMPRAAFRALDQAAAWKRAPHRIEDQVFLDVPGRMRNALSRLIGAPEEEIILGNSTSYGLHLLANGLPLNAGDEVLLVEGDFPATTLPWLGLRHRGITTRFLDARGGAHWVDVLSNAIGASTRVLCASWINSFTGEALDLVRIGEVCHQRSVWFVVNGTQGIGAVDLSVSGLPVDALVSCGFKWMCGPYGTGFCWMTAELLQKLEYNQAYWLPMAWRNEACSSEQEPPRDLGAKKYDVFGTANFFNFMPWCASVEHLADIGIAAIEQHDQRLVRRLLAALDRRRYRLIGPNDAQRPSSVVVVSHSLKERNVEIHQALRRNGIDVALRRGNLRIAPHLFNTERDVDRCVDLMNQAGH